MNHVSIEEYGAVPGGEIDCAFAIQDAVDRCHRAGGGTVVVPAGQSFLTGSVELKSNVTLHVSPGSELVSIVEPVRLYDYRARRWFWALNAENVAITGSGKFNGMGHRFMKEKRAYGFVSNPGCPRALSFFGCKGVRLTGFEIKDSADWAIHPAGCEDLLIDGVSIYNDLMIPNCDGIDPDHCRNVRITNCHIESGDDGIVIKTRDEFNEYGPCENILISNCTIVSTSCGIKIGTETHQDIRNVLIQNCVIQRSNRAIGICHRDAGTVENIMVSNLVTQTRLFSENWWGRSEPIYITSLPREHGKPLGKCRNIIFRDVIAHSESGIYLQGWKESRPEKITMENVSVHIEKQTKWPAGIVDPRPTPPDVLPHGGQSIGEPTPWGALVRRNNPGIYMENIDGINLRNCSVSWGESKAKEYTYALECRDVTNLELVNFQGQSAWPGELGDRMLENTTMR